MTQSHCPPEPLNKRAPKNSFKTPLKNKGLGILLTDHNVRETLSSCDEAYLIREGKIWIHGTPQEIVENDAARRFYLGEDFKL